jgi:hypothetical protein
VQQATSADRDQREPARRRLKKLLLEEFKRTAVPGQEYYGHFYPLARKIDAAVS